MESGEIHHLNLNYRAYIMAGYFTVRDLSGNYEFIRHAGSKYHFFSDDLGRDVLLTKQEFNHAKENGAQPLIIERKHM